MLQYKFVEFVPDKVDESVLYISIEYCTAIHKCVCGCGNEVVTPLSPTDWKLTFNGKSITLYPSIGNWNFECQSHYWIRNNKIEFAGSWTEREIRLGRENDLNSMMDYFEESADILKKDPAIKECHNPSIWHRLSKFFKL